MLFALFYHFVAVDSIWGSEERQDHHRNNKIEFTRFGVLRPSYRANFFPVAVGHVMLRMNSPTYFCNTQCHPYSLARTGRFTIRYGVPDKLLVVG